jgi:hypothetical protein
MTGREWQTMAFLTLGTMQLSVALALRGRPESISTGRRLDLAVARNRVPTPIGPSVIFSDRNIRGL